MQFSIFCHSVRGVLISIFEPAFISGVLLSYLFGNFLNCADQAKIQLIPSVIFGLALFFIPETPQYYIKRNNKIVVINWIINFKNFSKLEFILIASNQIGKILQRHAFGYREDRCFHGTGGCRTECHGHW